MGKGNFLPWNPRDEHGYFTLACEYFYVDICDEEGYDDMMNVIQSCLPKTFKQNIHLINNDECIQAENELISLSIGNNETSYAIVIREREIDSPARHFAYRYVQKLYVKIRNRLFELGFKLSLRRDAWTCTPITQKIEENDE